MQGKINKNLYRAILIISFIAANALILFGISSVFGFLNTGADRSTMLHTEIKSSRMYLPRITWDTTHYDGRPMKQQSLEEIERDYLNAWYVKNLALETNKKYGVEDYYTDSARVNIYNAIAYNEEHKLHFTNTTTNHEPELLFYSADGQLVVFNDHQVIEYSEGREIEDILYRSTDTSSYKIMMLLEDGFWRIRHLRKQRRTKIGKAVGKPKNWEIKGNKIFYKGSVYPIEGINYYPKDTPWDMFGEGFDSEIIAEDLQIIAEAGLNTIRIFLQYEDFGKAAVQEEKLVKLQKTLDAAQANNLKVVVTLFDFYGDYSVLDWTLTHEHARQIVSRFKDHEAIIAWDLKNEPDLDFKSRGEEEVLNWLKFLIPQIRRTDPNHLLTVGWSSPEAAHHLKDELDLVSFHYYKDKEQFLEIYTELQEAINKPLVLQEFGISSYNGLLNPLGYNEADQAEYHNYMQDFFSKDQVSFMSWTLYDFDEVPTSVVGRLPWRKARQKKFGFLDTEGHRKPSFKYIN
ncbi:cellulase family glycosylhydrolase [Flavimarina sp. Hel_I_48]|uniref:cellulase family glycosylhydrolase n=1 Tax=Flavimarina sp. Hel_I_48 TaxID=1392488 RepID=UPI0004DFC048|nr:cellulase family glycosylhydrolase [Flavimarina sp. Hel_I_48]